MIDRWVAILIAGCAALVGLIAVEVMAGDDVPAAPRPNPAPLPAPPQAQQKPVGVAELVAAALAEPLFSPTRRAAAADIAADTALSGVRLSGIILEPDRRTAIFAIAGGKPVTRSEGEELNDWRLEAITAQEVSLSGPTGMRTLTPKPDLKLVRPPPPPPPPPAPANQARPAAAGGEPEQPPRRATIHREEPRRTDVARAGDKARGAAANSPRDR